MYRRLLFPIYAPSSCTSLAQEGMLVLVPLYVLALGYSPATAAFVAAARGLGMLLVDLPIGLLAARHGERAVMLGGLTGLTVAMIGLALASTPLGLALSALLSGAAFSAWMLGRQSYLAGACASAERGRAIAVLGGLMRVGALTGPLAAGLIADRFGFPSALLVSAGLCALAAVFVAARARPVDHDAAAAREPAAARLSKLIADHGGIYARAGFASISLQLMRSARAILLPLMGHALGLDLVTIALVATLAACADLVLFLPAGLVMDRYGRKWSAVPCMIGLAATLALLPLVNDFTSLVAVAMAMGLANGMGSGVVLTLGADLAPAHDRATFLGVWRLIGDTGRAGAPLLVGALVAQVGSLGLAAWVIGGVGLVGAGVWSWLVPETLER
ncbi:MAG: MFS transporter [Pseudomonadota bacterium]